MTPEDFLDVMAVRYDERANWHRDTARKLRRTGWAAAAVSYACFALNVWSWWQDRPQLDGLMVAGSFVLAGWLFYTADAQRARAMAMDEEAAQARARRDARPHGAGGADG